MSFIWLSLLSSFENGAAIPPWAQLLEVLIPSEFFVITHTFHGAKFKAALRPATPPPTITTSGEYMLSVIIFVCRFQAYDQLIIEPCQ